MVVPEFSGSHLGFDPTGNIALQVFDRHCKIPTEETIYLLKISILLLNSPKNGGFHTKIVHFWTKISNNKNSHRPKFAPENPPV